MSTKRFIAGAVCPRCGEMDRLVSYENEAGVFKECVACDFEEKQIAQVEVGEIGTRVNHAEREVADSSSDVSLVKILDPKSE
jgi:uncharacterized protein